MAQLINRITYNLYLPADLHMGSGVGLPGVVDEHVVRDHENFAFAPFSEIKGIVRDSCVRLMRQLDCLKKSDYACKGQQGLLLDGQVSPVVFCIPDSGESCILCTLFGSPLTPAHWWFSPATYKQAYRAYADREGGLLAWRDSSISAHAAIDSDSKRASEGQLFNLEVVRLPDKDDPLHPFAVWEGEILRHSPSFGWPMSKFNNDECLGWLLAALLATRRIGGRRRRGWGRCRFVLVGDERPQLEQRLRNWLGQLQAKKILIVEDKECDTPK